LPEVPVAAIDDPGQAVKLLFPLDPAVGKRRFDLRGDGDQMIDAPAGCLDANKMGPGR